MTAKENAPADAGAFCCFLGLAKVLERFIVHRWLMHASGMNDPNYKHGGKFKVVPPEEVARILKA